MDKLLKPDRLELDPAETNSEGKWLHWKQRFDNYINSVKPKDEQGNAMDLPDNTVLAASQTWFHSKGTIRLQRGHL